MYVYMGVYIYSSAHQNAPKKVNSTAPELFVMAPNVDIKGDDRKRAAAAAQSEAMESLASVKSKRSPAVSKAT